MTDKQLTKTFDQTAENANRRIMALVVDAGDALLGNGGEVFRVQETMQRMAEGLALPDFHAYVLTSGIFTSAAGGTLSEVRHLPHVTVNLQRVEAVNALSREVVAGKLDVAGAEQRLREIRAMPAYSRRAELVAAALGTACFAYLFGARGVSLLVAGLAGIMELLVGRWLRGRQISRIFRDIVAAAVCMAVVLACGALLPGINTNSAVIGALMVLTPGVALVMGIRDFINADYLSGTIRLIDAVLIAGSLACGVGISYTLARSLWGVVL